MRGCWGRSRGLLGHLDREAVGGLSEKFPWEELRWGGEVDPGLPSVPAPAHQRILESADTMLWSLTGAVPRPVCTTWPCLPSSPVSLLLLPSAGAAPAGHPTPTPLHLVPPSLFLVLLSPCLGSCCSLPYVSSDAAPVKHSLLIPLHGGLGTHSVQRSSPVDPGLTTGNCE